MLKVLMAVPVGSGSIDIDVLLGIKLVKEFKIKDVYVNEVFLGRTLIHAARNAFWNYAIDNGYDYVFFVDDDTIIYKETLLDLLKHKHEADLITGIYPIRSKPHLACVYVLTDDGRYAPIADLGNLDPKEIDGCGMGCALIKVDKTMPADPFNMIVKEGGNLLGEDFSFCERYKANGHKIIMIPGVRVGHQIKKEVAYFKTDNEELVIKENSQIKLS